MNTQNIKVSYKTIEGIDKPVSKIFFGTAIKPSYIFSSKMNIFAIMSTENPERIIKNVISSNSPLSEEGKIFIE